MPGFSFDAVRSTDSEATRCLREYYAELDHVFPTGFNPDEWGALSPEDTDPPHGCFLLVYSSEDGTRALGCGAVKTMDAGFGEIKRMWLDPSIRGQGLGRVLLHELEREAAVLGHQIVRLDTSTHLPTAVAMYKSCGYTEIERYNDNPYAGHWFEKPLSPAVQTDLPA